MAYARIERKLSSRRVSRFIQLVEIKEEKEGMSMEKKEVEIACPDY